MCRLLYVKSAEQFDLQVHLEEFAKTAENSPEDQSHGWGCAWIDHGKWNFYHSLTPVWEDDLGQFRTSACLLAHARSAYKNEGIALINNMPFFDGSRVFIFNGELQGVRIREKGRIGAEKVFNFVKRFDDGDPLGAIEKGVGTLEQKTRYVRAMNFIIAEPEDAWLNTLFGENPGYFQMHEKITGTMKLVGSSPYENDEGWIPIANRTVKRLA